MDGPLESADGPLAVFNSQQGYLSDGAAGGGFSGVFDDTVGHAASYAFSSPMLFHPLTDDTHGPVDSEERSGSKRTFEDANSDGHAQGDDQNAMTNTDNKRRKKDTENWDTMYARLVEYQRLHGVSSSSNGPHSLKFVASRRFCHLTPYSKNTLVPKRYAKGKCIETEHCLIVSIEFNAYTVSFRDCSSQTRNSERTY